MAQGRAGAAQAAVAAQVQLQHIQYLATADCLPAWPAVAHSNIACTEKQKAHTDVHCRPTTDLHGLSAANSSKLTRMGYVMQRCQAKEIAMHMDPVVDPKALPADSTAAATEMACAVSFQATAARPCNHAA